MPWNLFIFHLSVTYNEDKKTSTFWGCQNSEDLYSGLKGYNTMCLVNEYEPLEDRSNIMKNVMIQGCLIPIPTYSILYYYKSTRSCKQWGKSKEKKEIWWEVLTHNGTDAHHVATVQNVIWQQGKGWITLVSHSTVNYTTRQQSPRLWTVTPCYKLWHIQLGTHNNQSPGTS